MLYFKYGVKLNSTVYTDEILQAVQRVWEKRGLDATVTSANDSTHGPNSYHMKDRAVDIRLWNVPDADRVYLLTQLKAALPAFYDVVLEKDHYHIEADEVKEKALK
mgnify:FL=1